MVSGVSNPFIARLSPLNGRSSEDLCVLCVLCDLARCVHLNRFVQDHLLYRPVIDVNFDRDRVNYWTDFVTEI